MAPLTGYVDAPDIVQNELALKLFQRLNIRTYFALLQLLHTECKHGTTEGIKDQVDFINPVVRRLLPPLRHYSFWLISRAALLSAHLDDPVIGPLIKDFWTVYVGTLTLILSGTSFEELPRLDYLLEEDEEIIGFAPLQEGQSTQAGTARKAKCQERGVKRHHPNIEMRCRVRDMVEDAIGLSHSEVTIFHPRAVDLTLTPWPVRTCQFYSRHRLFCRSRGLARTWTLSSFVERRSPSRINSRRGDQRLAAEGYISP